MKNKRKTRYQVFKKKTKLKSQYKVEGIIDMTIKEGRRLYFVKWQGYDEKDNTWEPIENLENLASELLRFEEREKEKIERMENNWNTLFKEGIVKQPLIKNQKARLIKLVEDNQQSLSQSSRSNRKSKLIKKPKYLKKRDRKGKEKMLKEMQSMSFSQEFGSGTSSKKSEKQIELDVSESSDSIVTPYESSRHFQQDNSRSQSEEILEKEGKIKNIQQSIPQKKDIVKGVENFFINRKQQLKNLHANVQNDWKKSSLPFQDVKQPRSFFKSPLISTSQIPSTLTFNSNNPSYAKIVKYTYRNKKKPLISKEEENYENLVNPHEEVSKKDEEKEGEQRAIVELVENQSSLIESQGKLLKQKRNLQEENGKLTEKKEKIEEKEYIEEQKYEKNDFELRIQPEDKQQKEDNIFSDIFNDKRQKLPLQQDKTNNQAKCQQNSRVIEQMPQIKLQRQILFDDQSANHDRDAADVDQYCKQSPIMQLRVNNKSRVIDQSEESKQIWREEEEYPCRTTKKSRIISKDVRHTHNDYAYIAKTSKQQAIRPTSYRRFFEENIKLERILSSLISIQELNIKKPVINQVTRTHKIQETVIFRVEVGDRQHLTQRFIPYPLMRDHYPRQLLLYLQREERMTF